MPFTTKEQRIINTYAGCFVGSAHQLVAYLNVLLDRDPTNRLTIDDPDVKVMLGHRSTCRGQ